MAELDIFMQKYINLVSTRCDCDKNVLESLYKELVDSEKGSGCTYKFLRGKNKDKLCGDTVYDNNFCKLHFKLQSTKEKIQGKAKSVEKEKDVEKVEKEEKIVEKEEKIVEKEEKVVEKEEIETLKVEKKIIPKEKKIIPKEKVKTEEIEKETIILKDEIKLPEPTIHFNSNLEKIMMHVNKSPKEITSAYEKIQPTQSPTKILKKRIIPPSLRPALKIGDKVLYNDGKKQYKGIVAKLVKDTVQLQDIYDVSTKNIDEKLYLPTRYLLKV